MHKALPTRQGYDLWSAVYDADGNALIALEEPVVKKLLGPVKGLRIADIGCGTGRHAVRLAKEGASVTGVDFSAGMLRKARAKSHAQKVRFLRRDIAKRLPFPDASFDRVLNALVVEHIKDLGPFFKELARICRPGGFVVVSAMHPALWLKGQSARFYDPKSGKEIRPHSHRQTVSDYVMAAAKAGLTIERLSEHSADKKLAKITPRAAKHIGWPLLVAMKLRRAVLPAFLLGIILLPLAASAKPPSRAHADAVVAETKAARDAAVAMKDDDEPGFIARYDYAAALFNVNRFDDAAAEMKGAAATKAAAKDTTYFVMAHAGLLLLDLARQDPKGASDEFSLMEARLPASFRETLSAQSYLTAIWFVKSGAGKGKVEMGELFRPASTYEKLIITDPEEGTYFQYRLTLAGVGLRSAMIKMKKPAKAATIKLGELPAVRKQL